MTEADKKEIKKMIDQAFDKFSKEHRISDTSMIVDTPTDTNAVVNVQYLINKGLIPSI